MKGEMRVPILAWVLIVAVVDAFCLYQERQITNVTSKDPAKESMPWTIALAVLSIGELILIGFAPWHLAIKVVATLAFIILLIITALWSMTTRVD